jgi:uncharacterized protein (TIGR03067 family)
MLRVVFSALVLLFGAVVSAEDKKADPLSKEAKKELQKLQGKWVLKRIECAGKKSEAEDPDAKLVLEFTGRKWIFDGQEKEEIIALDPTTSPKCMDLKSVEKERKGQVEEAIYKIDGDTLTICWYQGKGKQRPTRFEAPAEQPDTILAVFKKATKEE